jgi:hypothetical protein
VAKKVSWASLIPKQENSGVKGTACYLNASSVLVLTPRTAFDLNLPPNREIEKGLATTTTARSLLCGEVRFAPQKRLFQKPQMGAKGGSACMLNLEEGPFHLVRLRRSMLLLAAAAAVAREWQLEGVVVGPSLESSAATRLATTELAAMGLLVVVMPPAAARRTGRAAIKAAAAAAVAAAVVAARTQLASLASFVQCESGADFVQKQISVTRYQLLWALVVAGAQVEVAAAVAGFNLPPGDS